MRRAARAFPCRVLLLACVLAPAAGLRAAEESEPPGASRPNIVVVLLDDMGWSDLGCYGGEVRTPHFDRLAENGLRFTAFYDTGRCCPTRASLLTGRWPHAVGMGRMTFDRGLPGYRGRLDPDVPTVAQRLREAGYRTAMVGKWHVSPTRTGENHMRHLNNQEIRPRFSDLSTYPTARGFESFYGVIWGVVNYYDPFSLVDGTRAVREVPDDYYVTDAFSDRAVERVEELARGEDPFFLYLAHCAPHWPLHALPEDIERYVDTYSAGWDAIRNARYERQVESGLLDADTAPLSPPFPPNRSWEDADDREWLAHAMACHAAMIERADRGIGRLVATLREAGELDDTLILVLSDNGASRERPSRPGFDRVSETRDGREVVYFGRGAPREVLPGPETTYASIGPAWANVSNTPFRRFKATQYEGGVRTPLIAHWPRGISVEPGGLCRAPGHVIDILPTCLELAGAEVPGETDGEEAASGSPDGRSLVPLLQGESREGHEALYFEHFGARAIRRGDWKLVAPRDRLWELYHLGRDATETRDLAEDDPGRVRRLFGLWETWAREADVLPAP